MNTASPGIETPTGERRLPELDGLRALAALSVLIAHFNPSPWSVKDTLAAPLFALIDAVAMANLGVVFFFVLSAFLLSWISTRELDHAGRLGRTRFYLRRVFRIWPLYFLTLLAALAATAPSALPASVRSDAAIRSWMFAVEHIWLYLLFVSNWSTALTFVGGYVDPSPAPLRILWSIAVEEQFYLVFPLLLPLALSSRRRGVAVGAVIIGGSVLFRGQFMALPTDRAGFSSAGLYYTTLAYGDVLLAGAVAGALYARRHPLLSRLAAPNSSRWIGLGLLTTTVAAGVVFRWQLWHPYAWYSTIVYGLVGLLFAIAILWVILNPEARSSSLLRSRAGRVLGSLSFGIYLWHEIVGTTLRNLLATSAPAWGWSSDVPVLLMFAAYVGLTLLLAAIAYVLVEQPALRLKDHLFPHGSPMSGTARHT